MTMEVAPIPLPLSADPSYFEDFGREIRNVDVGNLTAEQFREISNLLYKVCRANFLYDSSTQQRTTA